MPISASGPTPFGLRTFPAPYRSPSTFSSLASLSKSRKKRKKVDDQINDFPDETGHDFRFPEVRRASRWGTFGETMSFLTAVGFEFETEHGQTEVNVGIEHAELRFNGPFGSGTAFNAKLGRLTPEMTQQFSHGYLLTESTPVSMLGFNPIGFHGSDEVAGFGHGGGHGGGGGGIALPAGVDGIEVYGIVKSRFDYSGGISNGMGPGEETADANRSKDFFGRVGYKFGGLSLDGEDYVYHIVYGRWSFAWRWLQREPSASWSPRACRSRRSESSPW